MANCINRLWCYKEVDMTEFINNAYYSDFKIQLIKILKIRKERKN